MERLAKAFLGKRAEDGEQFNTGGEGDGGVVGGTVEGQQEHQEPERSNSSSTSES